RRIFTGWKKHEAERRRRHKIRMRRHPAARFARRTADPGRTGHSEGALPVNPRIVKWLLCALIVPATQLLSGCGTPVASSNTNELPFDQAVTVATDALIKQTQTLPGFLAKMEAKVSKKGLLVDPMLDASSGQQTGITKQLEQLVTARLKDNYPGVEILPFQAA